MKLCRPLRTIRKGILKKNKFWAFVPRTSVHPVSPIDQSAGRAQQSIPCHSAMLIERKRPEHVNNSQQVQKLQISWLIHLAPGRTIRLNEFEKCDYWEIMKLAEELATQCTIRLRKAQEKRAWHQKSSKSNRCKVQLMGLLECDCQKIVIEKTHCFKDNLELNVIAIDNRDKNIKNLNAG